MNKIMMICPKVNACDSRCGHKKPHSFVGTDSIGCNGHCNGKQVKCVIHVNSEFYDFITKEEMEV